VVPSSEIDAGEVVAGRYRIVDRIGTGGMAVVLLAVDTVLDREVAIKRLHAVSEDNRARFQREARLGAYLNHPNLVTVFDTVPDEDAVLIVMEYVPGTRLSDVIERGDLVPTEAVEILSWVATALDHAHSHGVVHRDVKPANVLLRDDGVVKLADLGVATAAHVSRITAQTDVVGTLTYIAPERLQGTDPGGPAADVYSLAAVGFEALAGRPPDRGATPVEILERSEDPPPDLRRMWPGAPPGAADALRRGLDPDPRRRQRSATELIEELDAGLASKDDETATRQFAAVPRGGVGARPPRWAVAGIGAGIAALVAIAIALNSVGDDAGQPTRGAGSGGGEGRESRPAERGDEAPVAVAEGAGDPAQGAQLNDRGYALIQQGQPEAAVPVLKRAVRSFPPGTTDLNYAYALFNLGNALRLSGRAQEAIPILERRLEIPNQTETVRQELEAARAEVENQEE
jgi:eukaryotic-like serine/threonine-protein kinase